MKGFTKDKKFHPIKPYIKVRMARDQSAKTQGVRLKLDKLTGQPNKFSNLSDDQLRNLITKNNKELGVAPRKKIPINRNDPNSMLVDSDELLMVSDDRKADETARAILELKNRSENELEKMRKESENDPITKAVKKLSQSANFHSSADHTWGWTETKPNLPSYGEGVAFAQHGADEGEKVHRFGKEGMGNRVFATLIGEDKLKEVLEDAKKEHLTTEFASINNLIIQADVITSSEKNRPVILKLKERERERYYMIAPRIGNEERNKKEPFAVGERKPTAQGDQDVIDAISGKKLTQSDLIAMQRAPRKKGDLSDEDFKRRQEIVRKLNDAKFERDKVAKRKIDATNEQQFKKKSLALGRANDKLETQKRKFKKEFGVEVVDI